MSNNRTDIGGAIRTAKYCFSLPIVDGSCVISFFIEFYRSNQHKYETFRHATHSHDCFAALKYRSQWRTENENSQQQKRNANSSFWILFCSCLILSKSHSWLEGGFVELINEEYSISGIIASNKQFLENWIHVCVVSINKNNIIRSAPREIIIKFIIDASSPGDYQRLIGPSDDFSPLIDGHNSSQLWFSLWSTHMRSRSCICRPKCIHERDASLFSRVNLNCLFYRIYRTHATCGCSGPYSSGSRPHMGSWVSTLSMSLVIYAELHYIFDSHRSEANVTDYSLKDTHVICLALVSHALLATRFTKHLKTDAFCTAISFGVRIRSQIDRDRSFEIPWLIQWSKLPLHCMQLPYSRTLIKSALVVIAIFFPISRFFNFFRNGSNHDSHIILCHPAEWCGWLCDITQTPHQLTHEWIFSAASDSFLNSDASVVPISVDNCTHCSTDTEYNGIARSIDSLLNRHYQHSSQPWAVFWSVNIPFIFCNRKWVFVFRARAMCSENSASHITRKDSDFNSRSAIKFVRSKIFKPRIGYSHTHKNQIKNSYKLAGRPKKKWPESKRTSSPR